MRLRLRFGRLAVVLVAVALVVAAVADESLPRRSCQLSEENRRFLQDALDGWERVSRDFLELDPNPLPLTVVFDGACVWHLEPDEDVADGFVSVELSLTFTGVSVRAQVKSHNGAIPLPSGGEIPARAMAFASLYEDGDAPFFVMALVDLWREAAGASGLDAPELALGIMAHEIVHTRQLVEVNRRVDELNARYELPDDIGDDIVEERFREVPAYVAAHEAESDVFYEAAAEADGSVRRELVAKGLEMVRARQDRYFTGEDEVFRELDGLFLNMEGVAVWAAHELLRNEAESSRFERSRNTWTQDEGLALFLLIDALVPDWKARVLGPELASPFALLGEVVRDQSDSESSRPRRIACGNRMR